jgi:hypothetical protein
MLIAYALFGHDNGAYFFEKAPASLFCPNCDSCLSESYIPDDIVIKSNYDIGCTYDGRKIVSLRFKSFCEGDYPGEVDFFQVTHKADFFYMKPRRILTFDVELRKTKFKGLCSLCGNYRSITGVTPAVLKGQIEPIPRGFYRTDIEFGSGRDKSFVIIIGIETREEIIRKRFRKPDIAPVYDKLPSMPDRV